jgi:ketosteroid isomerase-like protein
MGQPVSQSPTAAAHRALDAFNRRDRAEWDEVQHPEVECLPSELWPETGRVVGRDALWEFYVGIDEVWEPGAWAYTEVTESGATVLAHQRRPARGRSSSAEVELSYWVRMTVAGGVIVQHEWFEDRPPEG